MIKKKLLTVLVACTLLLSGVYSEAQVLNVESTYDNTADEENKNYNSKNNKEINNLISEYLDILRISKKILEQNNFDDFTKECLTWLHTTKDGIFLSEYCNANNIDKYIIIAIIKHESNFNSTAKNSKSGAYGYMQLLPKYAKKYANKMGLQSYTDGRNNIKIGIQMLVEWLEVTDGNMFNALCMYAGGYKGTRSKTCRNYANWFMTKADKLRIADQYY